jgi:hypothetical protein
MQQHGTGVRPGSWPGLRRCPGPPSGLLPNKPLLAIGLSFLLLAAAVARGDSTSNAGSASAGTVVEAIPAPAHPREKTYMKRKWGVETMFVRETAAGYMLEFRYKVLDPEKAKPLFARKTKPVMTDVKSGAKLIVPTPAKTGALRNSDTPLADHTYWMFFSNPGKIVKAGDLVNLQIGDFAVEGLVVQ